MANIRPDLTEVYNKIKEHGKVDKLRWYRECNLNIELSKLSVKNIKDTSQAGIVFGIAFSVENDRSKSWIQIFNTDMREIIFSTEDDDESADIVIKMNDGSQIKMWFDFTFA